MYRVARYFPTVETRANWTWYLNQAYHTIQYCLGNNGTNCSYSNAGLMGETVLGELLTDLGREGWRVEHDGLEASMLRRVQVWSSQANPYGSEQAWDSTGQEGIYYWSNYFGYNEIAQKTVEFILGYMPTVAHWGWNGNARRYWDFAVAGGISRIERQLHHYGSGLNALPLLSLFRNSTVDLHALRVGYGGTFGPLTNIDEEGFAAAAFHSFPDTLKWDPYSSDYGPNFLGLALGHACIIVNDPQFGWLAFGGNLEVSQNSEEKIVTVQPRDAVRKKVFIASLGLQVEISSGAIQKIIYNADTQVIRLEIAVAISEAAVPANSSVIWLTQSQRSEQSYLINNAEELRGGYSVHLPATVVIGT